MGNKFFDHFGGVVTIKLLGLRPEKIINMALARGIFLWDLKKDQYSMSFRIRSSGYEALKSLVDEHGYEMEVIDKKGLPFMKSTIIRRVGFLGGALGFIVALYILSSFVWFVSVSGNQKIDDHTILRSAAKYGLYKGAARWNFSRVEAEQAMLRDIKELTYIKIDIRGVKADIQVVEKVLPADEVTGPCHLLARKDGVIEEILILEGQAKVREGDAVARGDVLISGIVFPEPNPYMPSESEQELNPYLVRARGIVKARVWYEGYGECSLYQESLIFTGREKESVYIRTPWNEFRIFGNDRNNFKLCESSETKKTITTSRGELAVVKIVEKEQVVEVKEYTEKEATRIAKEKALKTLQEKIDKSQPVSDSKIEVLSSPSESVLRIKVAVETIEDITLAEPINTGENGN
ncbi:stage iv sporulation protein [hydrocarbon metagenome]|uniref:Stage iv sporulation protein n=1 Tax=hydrocarbon metagenome TaxID=938273 RepID=A0A0W8E6Q8_9ZZZZ